LSAHSPALEPAFLRDTCEENGIKIVYTHVNADRLLNDVDNVIKEHEILGCKYIGLGMLPERYRSPYWYPHFKEDYLPTMRAIRDAGKRFLYHNHNIEFERYGDKLLMTHMLEDFAPDEMGVVFDTYWAHMGGADVVGWIHRLKGRLPVVHLKDVAVVGGQTVMAPVGEGNLNFPAILKAFEEEGSEYALVEQDICIGSPFECLKSSYDYLKSIEYV
jgi:sugar phosphate isomerase/epimerase